MAHPLRLHRLTLRLLALDAKGGVGASMIDLGSFVSWYFGSLCDTSCIIYTLISYEPHVSPIALDSRLLT